MAENICKRSFNVPVERPKIASDCMLTRAIDKTWP